MKPLGNIVSYRKGKPPKMSAAGTVPVLTPGYLRTGAIEELAEPTSHDVVLAGDEIILLWDGSNAGEFFRARPGILSSTMVVFDFDEKATNRDYLFYELKRFEPQLKAQTSGSGIPHVDKEILLGRELVERDPKQQAKVVEVLATIDRAIEQTEELLAKQQRVKTGQMHDLLTRGIDAEGQLRDPAKHAFKKSPLGMIPESWKAGRLGSICDLQVGQAFKSRDFREDEGIRLLRGENVGNGKADWSDTKRLPCHMAKDFIRYELNLSDIVIGMDRTFTAKGCKITVLNQDDIPALLVQRVGRFVPGTHARSFLLGLLYSTDFQTRLMQEQKGMDIPHLSKEEILGVDIRIPPPPEAELIGEKLAAHFKAEARMQKNSEKLLRLKSGLMEDLLTGRVPVKPLLANQTN